MEKSKLNGIIGALDSQGWQVSEIKEEYRKEPIVGGAFCSDYGSKTGAVLLRITPSKND
jgi:hypothetical protein